MNSRRATATLGRAVVAIVLTTTAASATGCATLIHGTRQKISIASDPDGAVVYVDSIRKCETPCEVELSRSAPGQVELRKAGFAATRVDVVRRFAWVSTLVGNVFLTYGIGIIVDFWSGGAYYLEFRGGPYQRMMGDSLVVQLESGNGSAAVVTSAAMPADTQNGSESGTNAQQNGGASASALGAAEPIWASAADLQTVKKLAVPAMRVRKGDEELGKILTEVMTSEASRAENVSVISSSDVDAMLGLEKQKEILGCSDDVMCMAQIGGALGVDAILVGDVGKVGSTFVLSIKLIDTRSSKVMARTYDRVKGEPDVLIDMVRLLIGKIVTSPKFPRTGGAS